MKVSVLRVTLGAIGFVQFVLGIVFLFFPARFAAMVGLAVVPAWAYWVFSMFSARAFGFAYGMFVAMRQPEEHRSWIRAMIVVQAIDWLGTLYFLMGGAVTLMQVSTASFLPVIFIVVLLTRSHTMPRSRWNQGLRLRNSWNPKVNLKSKSPRDSGDFERRYRRVFDERSKPGSASIRRDCSRCRGRANC